jgi:hypothetical protein
MAGEGFQRDICNADRRVYVTGYIRVLRSAFARHAVGLCFRCRSFWPELDGHNRDLHPDRQAVRLDPLGEKMNPDTLQLLNGITSLVVAAVLSGLILSPSAHEGIIVKTGLIMMVLSLLSNSVHTIGKTEDWNSLWAAGFALRLGLLTVLIGVGIRRIKTGSWSKALDWTAPA